MRSCLLDIGNKVHLIQPPPHEPPLARGTAFDWLVYTVQWDRSSFPAASRRRRLLCGNRLGGVSDQCGAHGSTTRFILRRNSFLGMPGFTVAAVMTAELVEFESLGGHRPPLQLKDVSFSATC